MDKKAKLGKTMAKAMVVRANHDIKHSKVAFAQAIYVTLCEVLDIHPL